MTQDVVANPQYGVEYAAELENAKRTGECPFCKPEFQASERVVVRDGGWIAVLNQHPTKDWSGRVPEHHLLLIPIRHAEELTEADVLSAFWLAKRASEKLGISGGALCMRFGDPKRSGATIMHRHMHLIVPRLPEAGEEPTKLPDGRVMYPSAVYFPVG